MKKTIKNFLLGILLPLGVLGAWETVSRAGIFSEQLLVPPGRVAATLVDLIKSGGLFVNLGISLKRVALGFLLGGSTGFLTGALLGTSRRLERFINPTLNAFKQVPLFAWMPLVILGFGIGELSKAVFISIGAFIPMAANTFAGVRMVPKEYIEVGRVFEYSRCRLLLKVILPAALPSILAGARLALSLSWMLLVTAEILGSESGIGYMMTWGRQFLQTDIVMAGVIIIGLAGFAMNSIVDALERHFLRWRRAFNAG